MAQQKDKLDWDDCARRFAQEAVNMLQARFHNAGLLLLQEPAQIITETLIGNARAVMVWMAKVQKTGVDIESADNLPKKCTACNAALTGAVHLWEGKDGKHIALCDTCDAAKKEELKK